MELNATARKRFWKKVSLPNEKSCWNWLGYLLYNGYGRFGPSGRSGGVQYAHRVSWVMANGPIKSGRQINHLCNNKQCVNPSHLYEGTQKENARDLWRSGYMMSNDHKRKIASALKGRKRPPSVVRAIAKKLRGRQLSLEHRLKISQSLQAHYSKKARI